MLCVVDFRRRFLPFLSSQILVYKIHYQSSRDRKYDSLWGSRTINKNLIDNYYVKSTNKKPFFALTGDIHSLSMFPLGEILYKEHVVNIFSHTSSCAYIEQGKTTLKGYYYIINSVNEFIIWKFEVNKGDIVVSTIDLNNHFSKLRETLN